MEIKIKVPSKPILYLLFAAVISLLIGTKITDKFSSNLPKSDDGNMKIVCSRTTSYNIPAEFKRALSLINQRLSERGQKENIITYYYNCLNIQYAQMADENTEGYFVFDEESSPDNLKIFVSNKYQAYDDVLTAILLNHELTHAGQLINYLFSGKEQKCIDKEIEAFSTQNVFMSILNPEEINSLIYRWYYNEDANPALQAVGKLNLITATAGRDCNKQEPCWHDRVSLEIRKMVETNPFYQKQCNLR